MSFLNFVILAIISAAVAHQCWYVYASRRTADRQWAVLLSNVLAINPAMLDLIREIPARRSDPNGMRLRHLWGELGGRKGLAKLLANVDAMLELATYAERWSDQIGPLVSELMREDAVVLRAAIRRVYVSYYLRCREQELYEALFEAGHLYELSRKRLLLLYDSFHCALKPELENVLWPL